MKFDMLCCFFVFLASPLGAEAVAVGSPIIPARVPVRSFIQVSQPAEGQEEGEEAKAKAKAKAAEEEMARLEAREAVAAGVVAEKKEEHAEAKDTAIKEQEEHERVEARAEGRREAAEKWQERFDQKGAEVQSGLRKLEIIKREVKRDEKSMAKAYRKHNSADAEADRMESKQAETSEDAQVARIEHEASAQKLSEAREEHEAAQMDLADAKAKHDKKKKKKNEKKGATVTDHGEDEKVGGHKMAGVALCLAVVLILIFFIIPIGLFKKAPGTRLRHQHSSVF